MKYLKNIYLLCAAGMSTSLLVEKMKAAAKDLNFECFIEAHSIQEADIVREKADIILLGPQVRFQLKKVQSICPGVIVDTIEPTDYGLMNGKKVIEKAMKLLGV